MPTDRLTARFTNPNTDLLDITIDLEEPEVRFELNSHGRAPNVRASVIHHYFGEPTFTHVPEGAEEALHCSSGELTPAFLDKVLPLCRHLRNVLDLAFSSGDTALKMMEFANYTLSAEGWEQVR